MFLCTEQWWPGDSLYNLTAQSLKHAETETKYVPTALIHTSAILSYGTMLKKIFFLKISLSVRSVQVQNPLFWGFVKLRIYCMSVTRCHIRSGADVLIPQLSQHLPPLHGTPSTLLPASARCSAIFWNQLDFCFLKRFQDVTRYQESVWNNQVLAFTRRIERTGSYFGSCPASACKKTNRHNKTLRKAVEITDLWVESRTLNIIYWSDTRVGL